MYKTKNIAVFGVSQDPSKYGYKIFTTLKDLGFRVYGLHPKAGQVNGCALFESLAQIPVPVEVAIFVIPPTALENAVAQCIAKGVREIWFQPGARSERAFTMAQAAGIRAINGCFMADNGLW